MCLYRYIHTYVHVAYVACMHMYFISSGWQPCVSEELLGFVQKDNDFFSMEISVYDEKEKKILPAQHVRTVVYTCDFV